MCARVRVNKRLPQDCLGLSQFSVRHRGSCTIFNSMTIPPTDQTLFLVNVTTPHQVYAIEIVNSIYCDGVLLCVFVCLHNLSTDHKERN